MVEGRNIFRCARIPLKRGMIVNSSEPIVGGSPHCLGSDHIFYVSDINNEPLFTCHMNNEIYLALGDNCEEDEDLILTDDGYIVWNTGGKIVFYSQNRGIFEEAIEVNSDHKLKASSKLYIRQYAQLSIGTRLFSNTTKLSGNNTLQRGDSLDITSPHGNVLNLSEGDSICLPFALPANVGMEISRDDISIWYIDRSNPIILYPEDEIKLMAQNNAVPYVEVPFSSNSVGSTQITLGRTICLQKEDILTLGAETDLNTGITHALSRDGKAWINGDIRFPINSNDVFASSVQVLGGMPDTISADAVLQGLYKGDAVAIGDGDQVHLSIQDHYSNVYEEKNISEHGNIYLKNGLCLYLQPSDKITVLDPTQILYSDKDNILESQIFVHLSGRVHTIVSGNRAGQGIQAQTSDNKTISELTMFDMSLDEMKRKACEDADFRNKLIAFGIPNAETWVG